MDKVSDGLYVGTVWALSSPRDMRAAGITHVVSLLRGPVTDMTAHGFRHLHIEIDDDDEEDLARFFAQTNAFIGAARAAGGAVLVHCIAGISRSVSVATAYLLYTTSRPPPGESDEDKDQGQDLHGHGYYAMLKARDDAEAAEQYVTKTISEIRRARPVANPNDSFREQLVIYFRSGCAVSLDKPLYRRWILAKQADGIPLTGAAPRDINYVSAGPGGAAQGLLKLRSNDTSADVEPQQPQRGPPAAAGERPSLAALSARFGHPAPAQTEPLAESTPAPAPARLTQLRCKKCRAGLASSNGFLPHTPTDPEAAAAAAIANGAPRNGQPAQSSLPRSCMHYFMEPAAWMKPELERGALAGKLACPRCAAKVGSYSWQGAKCSCGTWITPAIELQRARVDEVVIRQSL